MSEKNILDCEGNIMEVKGDSFCFELLEPSSRVDLTCPVCLEVFYEAKTMPCGHSFCSQCIQTIIQRSPAIRSLSCPSCRTQHNSVVIHQLPINQRLQSLAGAYKRQLSLGGDTVTLQTNEVDLMTLSNISDPTTTLVPNSRKSQVLEATRETAPACLEDRHSVVVKTGELKIGSKLFYKQVLSMVLINEDEVCVSTGSAIYCYRISTGGIRWTQEQRNVQSLAASHDLIFAAKNLEKLEYESGRFCSWHILVLNLDGSTAAVIQAGLGQECSVAVSSNLLTIVDTGSYRNHAQPCVTTVPLTNLSSTPKVHTTPRSCGRLVKPKIAIVSPTNEQFVVYDAGDGQLKSYKKTATNSLNLKWSHKVKGIISLANHTLTTMPDYPVFAVLLNGGIELRDMRTGKAIERREIKWCSSRPTSMSLNGDRVAVTDGYCVYIYTFSARTSLHASV